ncbi:MAG: hypothetical protein COB59_11930 [Rhodospirillaceae bacterium]|nr:MAG: hypothetical protein COB59_11930 [Rhodospirillaceae bacterium]
MVFQGQAENITSKQSIFIIDNLPVRVQKIKAAFGGIYDLQVFSDGNKALEAMRLTPPDAVISDDHTLQSNGHHIHRTKCTSEQLKDIPFFISSDALNGPYLPKNGTGATDYFFKRPVNLNQLLNLVLETTTKSIEDSWSKRPPKASNALHKTSECFSTMAQAIANNTPLNKTMITSGCNPLIECVQEDQYKEVLQGLKNHHNFVYTHSMRVAVFMCVFAKAYDVSKEETITLTTAGFMHDVGEMALPSSLLNKQGQLTALEIETVRHHVQDAGDILSAIDGLHPVIPLIAELHHERLDGSGYPKGLKGTEINELGRMIAIADVFAALTDLRPYRQSLNTQDAFTKMEGMGDTLDLHMIRLFRDALE